MRHDNGVESLDAHVTIHDRSQFEVQFTYGISPEHLTMGKDSEHYRVEAFYFFPSNMGITALNFPREDFYRSLNAYIRFKTPDISELALLDPLNRQSPLNVLSFFLKRFAMGEALDEDAASAEARLFGTVLSNVIRTRAKEVEAMLDRAKTRGEAYLWRELEGQVSDMMNTIPEILAKYRALVADYRTFEPRVSQILLDRLTHVDEFLTYRFDHALASLHFHLASAWSAPVRLDRVSELIHAAAEAETEYRNRQGYVTLSPGDDQALALYTYRSGALKKLVDQVLYLDVKTVQETNRWRNLAAMFGAMSAAFFAGFTDRSVTLPLYQHSLWLGLALFAIFYVLKDRMKEVLREYVWERVSRFFPDNKLTIFDPTKGIDVGRCHERLRYLTKAQVPADVLRVRNASHAIDLDQERKETVVVYRNDLKLYAREILSEHQRRTHIKHILRFGVEDLLARLDNPTAKVQFYDAESKIFCRLRAPKVYHLNVVFKLTRWDDHDRLELPQYTRIRVVLDKNGIHRIDTVVTEGDPYQARGRAETPEPVVEKLPQEEDTLF
jgi:hypothetical protein